MHLPRARFARTRLGDSAPLRGAPTNIVYTRPARPSTLYSRTGMWLLTLTDSGCCVAARRGAAGSLLALCERSERGVSAYRRFKPARRAEDTLNYSLTSGVFV